MSSQQALPSFHVVNTERSQSVLGLCALSNVASLQGAQFQFLMQYSFGVTECCWCDLFDWECCGMEKIQAFYQVRFLQSFFDQNVYMSNTKIVKKKWCNFLFAFVIDECKSLKMCQ